MKVRIPKMNRPVKTVWRANCVRAGIDDAAEE